MTAVEVAPGVLIDAEGHAYGPGLEAALARAADVATLDDARRHGYRVTLELLRHNDNGAISAAGWATVYVRGPNGVETRYQAQTDEPGVSEDEARRAAADAIRNGRVPA